MVKIFPSGRLKEILAKVNPLRPLQPKSMLPEYVVESLSGRVYGKKLAQYPVGPAEVFVSYDGRIGHYEVSEPALSEREKEVYRDLFENFIYALEPEAVENKDVTKYIEGAIWRAAEELGLLDEVRKSFAKYRYFIERDGLGYGKLHIPVMDPNVAEITAVGYTEPVYVVHRNFADLNWLRTNIFFNSELELQNFNLRLAQKLGKSLTAAVPMVDVTTPEGHRVSLTFGDEITHPGSTFSLRKFPEEPYSLAYLIARRMLTPLMAAYLWQVFEMRGFVQVLGTVGGGKSTLLQALLASVNPNAKIITVEDVMELNLPHENWQRFHTRPVHFATSERFEVDLFDLIKLVMRHRPDYVAVGEVRGEEIKTLTHASSLGHSCASTFHSFSPEAAIARMRAPPMDLKDADILQIWCMPVAARLLRPNGEVVYRVNGIYEINPTKDGRPEITTIFRYNVYDDSFSPNKLSEVIKRSRRLREAAEAQGLSERDLAKALQRKVKFLEDLVRRKEFGYRQYVEKVREFYSGG